MERGSVSTLVIGGIAVVLLVMALPIVTSMLDPYYTVYEFEPDGFHWFFAIALDLNHTNIVNDGSIICEDAFLGPLLEGPDYNIDYDSDPCTFTANLAGQGDAHCNYTYVDDAYNIDTQYFNLMQLIYENIPLLLAIGLIGIVAWTYV